MSINYKALLREWSLNYRSFSCFKKRVEAESCSRECLEAFACLLQKSQLKKEGYKGRFSRRFFEVYGSRLAGIDGCDRPVLNHQRVKVPYARLFVAVVGALFRFGCFNSTAAKLARSIDAGFDTGYSLATLERELRVGSLGSDKLFSLPEDLKSRKRWCKKGGKTSS